jgi:hypothetical protein
MRDIALSLSVASNYGQRLSRIQLQKFIYLIDVVSPLFYILPPQLAHQTYKHGPYDVSIQNAVDVLAFRGLVKINGVQKHTNGTISAEYTLNSFGQSWVDRLVSEQIFVPKWEAAQAVGLKINKLGWYRLVDLVYAEPTFIATRPKGYGQELHSNDGLSSSAAFLMAMMDRALRYGHDKDEVDGALIVELFFRYLDQYDRVQRTMQFSVEE